MSYPQPGDLDAVRGRYEAVRRHLMAIARDVDRTPMHPTVMALVAAVDDAVDEVNGEEWKRTLQDEAVEASRERNQTRLRSVPTPWSRTHRR